MQPSELRSESEAPAVRGLHSGLLSQAKSIKLYKVIEFVAKTDSSYEDIIVKRTSRWIGRSLVIIAGLYGLYVIKSALGINLLENYHAIDILKMPVQAIRDQISAFGA